MPINIKPIDQLGAKYVKRASAAGPDYQTGVQNPKRDWQANASAAQPTWAQAVQEAATSGRFGKGVAAAGNAKWQAKASTIGAQRYPQGVNAAQPQWQAKVTPYIQALSQMSLPARGVKGTNIARVQAVDDLLHRIKTAG